MSKILDFESEIPFTLDQIRLMREMNPGQFDQNRLSQQDRASFARELVKEDPLIGVPSLPFAIPADYIARKMGIMKGRSEPHIQDIIMGLKGYTTGINDLIKGRK